MVYSKPSRIQIRVISQNELNRKAGIIVSDIEVSSRSDPFADPL
jgi:hypothetical protein